MSTVASCGYFRPTMKGNLCKCGAKLRDHAEYVQRIANGDYKWGWRARVMAQPDAEDCE